MRDWRIALKIARRELARSRGRSLLALAMIMLPIVALGYAAVVHHLFSLTPTEQYERRFGASDAALSWQYSGAIRQDSTGDALSAEGVDEVPTPRTGRQIAAVLPPGSRVIPVDRATATLRTAAGIGTLDAYAFDVADPLTGGLARIVDGRAPQDSGQIAVSRQAAKRLGVGLSGTVLAGRSHDRWQVTAVVEFPADLGEVVLFPAARLPADAGQQNPTIWLARTPAPLGWPQVLRLNAQGVSVASRAVYAAPPTPAETPYAYDGPGASAPLGIAVIAGLLGFLQVVLLAGPAFGVGARRRQRELAMVAVNGGAPGHLYRIVLADGLVLGGIAAVLGTVVAITAALATRPLLETQYAGHRAGHHGVLPWTLLAVAALAVVSGAGAALVPAVNAARMSPIAALAGLRGVTRGRRGWWIAGAVITVAGIALSAHGAWHTDRDEIIVGLVGCPVGVLLLIPSLVGLAARTGRLAGVAVRIALRDAARNRLSAAAAIAAIMAAVSTCVIAGVYTTSNQQQQANKYRLGLPLGSVYVPYDRTAAGGDPAAGRGRVAAIVRENVPVTDAVEVPGIGCRNGAKPGTYCSLLPLLPADQRCFMLDLPEPYTAAQQAAARRDTRCRSDGGGTVVSPSLGYSVADARLMTVATHAAAADLRRAADTLAAGGVVIRDSRYLVDGKVTLTIRDTSKPGTGQDVPEEKMPRLTVPGYVLTSGIGTSDDVFFSASAVTRAGFAVVPGGFLASTARPPSPSDEDRLRSALLAASDQASRLAIVEHGPPVPSRSLINILELVAILITIGATGIATSLAAVDGRPDMFTLGAVGASPGFRRVLSLARTGLIAGLGAALGTGTGVVTVFAVLTAYNRTAAARWPLVSQFPLALPVRTIVVVLALPLVAMCGAALFTSSRLTTERRGS